MSQLILRIACALITFALPALSQVQNGAFNGQITDPSGAVVNQAQVFIHNLGRGYTLEVRSNRHGVYEVRELILGQYQISAEMPGFQIATSGALTLSAGTVVRADFPAAGASEGRNCRSAGAAVNTENARLTHTVDPTMIASLPLNGRNVYDLIQYALGDQRARGGIRERCQHRGEWGPGNLQRISH